MTTVNNGTVSTRLDRVLRSAYTAAGLDPALIVVTQGSYTGDVDASGSTHDGGGAADLRTWNLPPSAGTNLFGALVTALRQRNACAWYRDEQHGGFDPHVHLIVRDEPHLSSGARSQVSAYDQGRNGLSNGGPDYHPRPEQHPIEWWDTQHGDPTEEPDVIMLQASGTNGVYLLAGNQLTLIENATDRDHFAAAGVPGPVVVSKQTLDRIAAGRD